MATYVCSDLHGAFDKFKRLLKIINFSSDDKMYILGDVIDRGENSIPLFLYIMEQDNIEVLLGNHELMMYDAYYGDAYDKLLWYRNGGIQTDSKFTALSETDKETIFDYIFHLRITVPDLKVNGKEYYLAHASFIDCPGITGKETLGSLDRKSINEAVWSRDYPYSDIKRSRVFTEHKDKTLISGHTPAYHFRKEDYTIVPGHIFYGHKGHYINVDCGCSLYAKGLNTGRLGCIRLDDGKEFYA